MLSLGQRRSPEPLTWAPSRLVREPLLIFALLAALVFGAERLLRKPVPGGYRIEVPAAQSEELKKSLRQELAREPNAFELDAARERWTLDEVAYREGLKLGLDRGNGPVRELVATAYKERLLAEARVPEPNDAELERYLAEHRDAFVEPVRYDFDTVASAAGPSEAAVWPLFDQLVKAVAPVSLPAEAKRHEAQSFKEVARAFGVPFAHALDAATPGRFELVDSTHGYLVVRLRQKSGGGTPALTALRPRLLEAVSQERRRIAAETALRERAAAYEIREE